MRLIDADALKARLDFCTTKGMGGTIAFTFKHMVDEQPTITPEPHWIPVTEDTPIEDGDYWCTFGAETGWFVDWCSWYHGRWVVWLNDIPNDVSNVIAWCKPFEPYKGVAE